MTFSHIKHEASIQLHSGLQSEGQRSGVRTGEAGLGSGEVRLVRGQGSGEAGQGSGEAGQGSEVRGQVMVRFRAAG